MLSQLVVRVGRILETITPFVVLVVCLPAGTIGIIVRLAILGIWVVLTFTSISLMCALFPVEMRPFSITITITITITVILFVVVLFILGLLFKRINISIFLLKVQGFHQFK